jgi:glycosyltransferase involved in cell wall biosynthesis
MERFDVCIPTLNSGKTLEKCLKAIKEVIPVNRIIIADGFSKDNTLEIAKKYGCEIFQTNKSLGEVREMLMKRVKTEWFFFIDADIVVNKKWFYTLIRERDEKVGAVHGFGLPKGLISFFRKLLLFVKVKFRFKQRGFTSNTLIRRKAVIGMKLPKRKRLEDIYLQEEVEKRGYKWKFALAFCEHLKTEKQVVKEALRDLKNLAEEKGFIMALFSL